MLSFLFLCMRGLAFIRTPGTFPALALQYWQHATAHSTSGENNITSYACLSFSVAALQFLPASNQFHLLPYCSCVSLSTEEPWLDVSVTKLTLLRASFVWNTCLFCECAANRGWDVMSAKTWGQASVLSVDQLCCSATCCAWAACSPLCTLKMENVVVLLKQFFQVFYAAFFVKGFVKQYVHG